MGKGLVVVVEDDHNVLRIYKSSLTKLGYTVLAATTGEEGLGLLRQHVPIVVVLDIKLPGIDGIEVCRRSRTFTGGGAPVIFITSDEQTETLKACIEAGGDDFLIKGCPLQTMLERVAYWARRGRRSMSSEQRNKILARTSEIIESEKLRSGNHGVNPSEGPSDQKRQLDFQDDQRVQKISDIFSAHKTNWPTFDDHSISARINRFGYVTGLVNAAAQENLELKVRFSEFLKASMIACGVADKTETETMFENWHELYDDANFSKACHIAETDYTNSVNKPTTNKMSS